MEPRPLNFSELVQYLREAVAAIVEPRRPSNNQRYALYDLVMSAFMAFFMQSESFLEHQRHLNSRSGRDNAETLFGVSQIPSIEQIRNVLDRIGAQSFSVVFEWVYQGLKQQKYLQGYECLQGNLLVTLDGSEYHRSQTIHCPCCSQQHHRNGQVSYFHQALLPAIVHPQQSAVISLFPEFITPQDGAEKQDCETNAAKRWLSRHVSLFADQPITLLGDDLYSRQPMCTHALDQGVNFVFVCREESHATLYEWVDFLAANGEIQTTEQRRWSGTQFERWQYRYAQGLPLRDEQPALAVNWCELTVIRESDGEQLYHNAWITNHVLVPQVVFEIGVAGRSRWKTENENHNVLKNRGYHLEHNFGHGQRHLAQLLLTLNLLAFLFHTVLHWVDERYERTRAQRGIRKGFFQDLLTLTKYFIFESWEHLLDFLLDDSPQRAPHRLNTS